MESIKTNNVPRDVIEAHELTDAERLQFDWINWGAIDNGEDSHQFIRYRGELESLSNFVRIVGRSGPVGFCHAVGEDSILAKWDGIMTDSFFSGLVIRWAKDENGRIDPDRVVVGLYNC